MLCFLSLTFQVFPLLILICKFLQMGWEDSAGLVDKQVKSLLKLGPDSSLLNYYVNLNMLLSTLPLGNAQR